LEKVPALRKKKGENNKKNSRVAEEALPCGIMSTQYFRGRSTRFAGDALILWKKHRSVEEAPFSGRSTTRCHRSDNVHNTALRIRHRLIETRHLCHFRHPKVSSDTPSASHFMTAPVYKKQVLCTPVQY